MHSTCDRSPAPAHFASSSSTALAACSYTGCGTNRFSAIWPDTSGTTTPQARVAWPGLGPPRSATRGAPRGGGMLPLDRGGTLGKEVTSPHGRTRGHSVGCHTDNAKLEHLVIATCWPATRLVGCPLG